MRNTIKNRIMRYLWEHSHRNKPMIPEGTVDTSAMNGQITAAMEKLKCLLTEDPDAFRKMQVSSRYHATFSPDFNDIIPACLYESRLCNIYGLQYYVMYSLLMPFFLKDNIQDMKILSFGCGSMIDGLSLSLVLKDYGDSFSVRYTGIDIAGWPMAFSLPFETRFIQKPMQEYWEGSRICDGNVIIFPTVLSGLREYPDETGGTGFCPAGACRRVSRKAGICQEGLSLLYVAQRAVSFPQSRDHSRRRKT